MVSLRAKQCHGKQANLSLSLSLCLSLSPFLTAIFSGVHVSLCLLKQRMTEVVVTTRLLLPSQQCQSTEGKISHSINLLTPSSPGVFLTWGLPTLSLTTNSSWLPLGRVAMPLISPLMPVPQGKHLHHIIIITRLTLSRAHTSTKAADAAKTLLLNNAT